MPRECVVAVAERLLLPALKNEELRELAVSTLLRVVVGGVTMATLTQDTLEVLVALVRPMARKWVQPKLVKTNADRILGQEAVVLEEIDNLRGIGQVKVGGDIWTAPSTQDEPIPKGTLVRVERIEGVKAIVSLAGPTEKEEAATTP